MADSNNTDILNIWCSAQFRDSVFEEARKNINDGTTRRIEFSNGEKSIKIAGIKDITSISIVREKISGYIDNSNFDLLEKIKICYESYYNNIFLGIHLTQVTSIC
jgi:hypothetical protein